MTKNAMESVVKLSLCLALVSCKSPMSFSDAMTSISSESSSTASSSSEITESDEIVIDSVCNQSDSDSQNSLQGDVMQNPFLDMSFSMGKVVHVPAEKCMTPTVIEDSDTKREILYEYDCPEIAGDVRFVSEYKDTSVASLVQTDVELMGKDKSKRHIKSIYSRERLQDGSVQIDKEFEESFAVQGVNHVITGTSFYDFAPEKTEDGEVVAEKGYVDVSGTVTHLKEGVVHSTRIVSSDGLHRSRCGFDEGSITIKDTQKTITIEFLGCGKKSVKTSEATE
ncbi:hypothetical protein [Bdellovibrio bacteriovorus]|uniref:hypothetical protein n=1 Tax=Bdellovibrio TaxID=958 RepID=UPI0035A89C94